jgi:hypothetical protein
MTQVNVRIRNIDGWRRALRDGPETVTTHAQRAVASGIFILDQQMIDPNYRFVTPRSQRTGNMAELKRIDTPPPGLRGIIGHKVEYAAPVYEYHEERGNDFMARFVRKTEDDINDRFENALQKATDEIARSV